MKKKIVEVSMILFLVKYHAIKTGVIRYYLLHNFIT